MTIENKFFTYNELKLLVKKNKICSGSEYRKMYKTLKSENNLVAPSNPFEHYGVEWEGWCEFLGKPILRKNEAGIYYEYDECKTIIKSKGLTSLRDFEHEIKSLILEDNRIPCHPSRIYRDKWEGWGEFLGTGNVQPQLRKYLPFNEAKKWAMSLGFRMRKEWEKLDRLEIPENIPKYPYDTYKNDGWVDFFDWLGITKAQNISYGEKKVMDYLTNNKIMFYFNKPVLDCKYKNKLRFDFFLPEHKICIEYDGIQHYKPVKRFGGEDEFNKTKKRDQIKNLFCEVNNIKLIRIPHYFTDNEVYNLLNKEIIKIDNK